MTQTQHSSNFLDMDIYSQPAAALDHGDGQPADTTYVSETDVAAYAASHAPDLDASEVEDALQSIGWRPDNTVAEAIDHAIAAVRDRR